MAARYVHGSTARDYAQMPEPARRAPVRREERGREERSQQVQERNRQRIIEANMASMNFVSFLVLALALTAAVYVCVSYVQLHSEMTTRSKHIVALESQVNDMKKQNDTMKEAIESSIDLQDVYKKATRELGMVHASENQVYTYSNKKSNRVIQHGDIPTD